MMKHVSPRLASAPWFKAAMAVLSVLCMAPGNCGGGGGGLGVETYAVPDPTTEMLTAAQVTTAVDQAVNAAASLGTPATIAVVDRLGNVLAVAEMAGAATAAANGTTCKATPCATISSGTGAVGGLEGVVVPSTLAAISKAVTAAYLSSGGNAFSTRTANQIIQQHFPVGVAGNPGGPLFGVQFSQLACSDLDRDRRGFDDGAACRAARPCRRRRRTAALHRWRARRRHRRDEHRHIFAQYRAASARRQRRRGDRARGRERFQCAARHPRSEYLRQRRLARFPRTDADAARIVAAAGSAADHPRHRRHLRRRDHRRPGIWHGRVRHRGGRERDDLLLWRRSARGLHGLSGPQSLRARHRRGRAALPADERHVAGRAASSRSSRLRRLSATRFRSRPRPAPASASRSIRRPRSLPPWSISTATSWRSRARKMRRSSASTWRCKRRARPCSSRAPTRSSAYNDHQRRSWPRRSAPGGDLQLLHDGDQRRRPDGVRCRHRVLRWSRSATWRGPSIRTGRTASRPGRSAFRREAGACSRPGSRPTSSSPTSPPS